MSLTGIEGDIPCRICGPSRDELDSEAEREISSRVTNHDLAQRLEVRDIVEQILHLIGAPPQK